MNKEELKLEIINKIEELNKSHLYEIVNLIYQQKEKTKYD